MSQQGPGGYGGGGYGGPPGGGAPPGGYGPPGGGYPPGGGAPPGGGYPPGGGAPPGGYGPPGGGYGPPGGGYPPGGGAPPQGGPPGYGPPGGPPPGYGPPQQPYGNYPGQPGGAPGAPPPKKNKTALFVGLGCLVVAVLGVIGAALSVYFVKGKVEEAQAQASALASAAAPALNNVTASPICAKAVVCCQAVIGKTAPGNSAALDACKGLGMLSDAQCQKQYEGQKTAASMMGASCP